MIVNEIKKLILEKELMLIELSINRIVLFGSVNNGGNNSNSDVDIAIWIKSNFDTPKKILYFSKIKKEIKNILGNKYKWDIISGDLLESGQCEWWDEIEIEPTVIYDYTNSKDLKIKWIEVEMDFLNSTLSIIKNPNNSRCLKRAKIRALEVIGQSLKDLTPTGKIMYDEYENYKLLNIFRELKGLRDILAHQYYQLNYKDIEIIMDALITNYNLDKEQTEKILKDIRNIGRDS